MDTRLTARTLNFDMSGYIPGANSLSGKIASEFPKESLNEIIKGGLNVRIHNLHKIKVESVNMGMFLAFLNDVASLSRKGIEIEFIGDWETNHWMLSHCFG